MKTATGSDDDRMPNAGNAARNEAAQGSYARVTPKPGAVERYRAGERNIHLSRTDRRILEEEA